MAEQKNKTCKCCNKKLPISEFMRNALGKYDRICKGCWGHE